MSALVKELEGLSSAEDIFLHFGVPYEPHILAACRLHILKRFHDYLVGVPDLDSVAPDAQRVLCRQQLERAYADFLSGPAIRQEAFPRLAGIRRAFVSLSAVRRYAP
jgi:nitrogenase-stabilizing/protective protein